MVEPAPRPPARPRLLLASASPSRAALLRAAGVEPLVQPADVDEDAVLARHTAAHGPASVAETVQLLATAKAEAVAAQLWPAGADPSEMPPPTAAGTGLRPETAAVDIPARVVLGCDSLLEVDGAALGKPHTPDRARERWRHIRGRSGVLHTGHQLISSTDRAAGTSSTTVYFAEISDTEIEAYVATGEPLEVAGAFTIEGYGSAFITGIEGDHHGVLGLSLPLLRNLLPAVGLSWTDLWQPPAR